MNFAAVLFLALFGHSVATDCTGLVASKDCNAEQTQVVVAMNDNSGFAESTWNRQTGQLHPVKVVPNYSPERPVACCSNAIVDSTDSTLTLGFANCNATKGAGPSFEIDLVAEDVVDPGNRCDLKVKCDYTGSTTPHTTTPPPTTTAPTTTAPPTTTGPPTTTAEITTPPPTTAAPTTTAAPSTTAPPTTPTTTTTTPMTTTPLPCTQKLSVAECETLIAKGWCTQPDHILYMRIMCGFSCNFCNGTLPTTTTTPGTTATTAAEPSQCSETLCKSEPGKFNCETCFNSCKDVKCADSNTVDCVELMKKWPCSAIQLYCAESCDICKTLSCGH